MSKLIEDLERLEKVKESLGDYLNSNTSESSLEEFISDGQNKTIYPVGYIDVVNESLIEVKKYIHISDENVSGILLIAWMQYTLETMVKIIKSSLGDK